MKGRIAFVDWIRVTACFMVMLVHASENFYGVFAKILSKIYFVSRTSL